MDVTSSVYEQLAALEEQELVSEDNPSVNLYTQLLALYVLTDDLMSAKLLWKRIPAEFKEPDSDLSQVWRVASILIRNQLKELPEVYQITQNRNWPPYIKKIINQIGLHMRQRMISLISSSYSHIKLQDVATLTGCSSESEAKSLVSDLSWTVDPAGFVVVVTKKSTQSPSSNGRSFESASFDSVETEDDDLRDNMNQEQLHRLTEYVAFLENH